MLMTWRYLLLRTRSPPQLMMEARGGKIDTYVAQKDGIG